MYNILLVEDEKRLQEIIVDYFKAKGQKVSVASNGIEALEKLEATAYDLVLLDIMMPKLDGFSVCKEVRKKLELPIIFITAKVDERDQLKGYALGADDYMTKPFSLSVLYAKSIALIKRAKGITVDEKLKANDICIDCKSHQVKIGDQQVDLTPMCYKLLLYFMHNKNQVLTREQIIIHLWGYDFEGDDRTLDTHIKKLRKALGKSGKAIHTVVKVGYKLEVRGDANV